MSYCRPYGSLALAAILAAGLVGLGCDEEPRRGEQPTENRPAMPESPGADDGDDERQTGAERSELERHTDETMEQCIEVVEQVMDCTGNNEFHDIVTGEGGGEPIGDWSEKRLERAAFFWQETGGRRLTCEKMFERDIEAFRDEETLDRMAEERGSDCVDFADVLIEAGALEALSEIDP
ncbi:MAG: hypothetical protein ACOCV2_00980 [Persicimonas sp.]